LWLLARVRRRQHTVPYDAGMPSLPSGTVTFVFTDIEDSTALLRRLGDGYRDVLADHRRMVRDAFGTNGVEIDTQGDAFFFAFPRAREAVAAAVEVQRAHAVHEWPPEAAVRVRIGLHTGEPAIAEEGYLGLDVVRAARICTAAHGGHVLLSETTRALLGSALPDGVSVFPLGERQLKGIEEPERVYELEIEGVETSEEVEEAVVEAPEPPPPPAPGEPPTRIGEQDIERRFDDLGKRLAAGIEEQVAERLERAFEKLETRPSRPAPEDSDVEDLVTRSASLEEKIRARVDAALRARGLARDED
jgi:class 3 adenylate cyclase